MDTWLFGPFVATIGKVIDHLVACKDVGKKERNEYRKAIGDTCTIVNSALNMVILRLGDILSKDEDQFLVELKKLDNYDKWLEIEREMRLCSSMNTALNEANRIGGRLGRTVFIDDWPSLCREMVGFVGCERDLASLITDKLRRFADSARLSPQQDPSALDDIRKELTNFRETLSQERAVLMQSEVRLVGLI
jgi:hypothetical protein